MTTKARRPQTTTLAALALALAASLLWASPVPGQDSSSSRDPFSEISPRAEDRFSETSRAVDVTSLEQFLSVALKTHPDIVAAEGKVKLAEAELRQVRFQVARDLIVIWNERSAAEQRVAEITKLAERGYVPDSELIQAKAKVAEIESQVSYLLGEKGSIGTESPAAADGAKSKRLPEGPQVEKILEALDSHVPLEFIDAPIGDIAEVLADECGVLFVVDPALPKEEVSIDVQDVPLGAALQVLEDIIPGIRFVVCDYGFLVTSRDSEAAATYISANEFWREQYAQQKTSAGRTPPTPHSVTPKAAKAPSKSSFTDRTQRASETTEPASPKPKPRR